MKTRLLLLSALLLSVFSFSQININEGFESGTIPTGWTTDLIDGVVTSTRSCGGTKSAIANFYSNAYATIYTSSYVSNGGAINLSFYARKSIGVFYGYKYLYYELNGSGTWNQIANVYSDFSTCTPVNATIAAGVIPNGANVKFRMQANRASANNNNYVYFDEFTAVQVGSQPTPQTIAEYNFDNTYNNILGNTPFTSAGTSFTTDRHGNTSGAMNINGTGSQAVITGLPYVSTTRSISVWAKTNALNNQINYVFHYGNSANGNGLAFRPNTLLYFANAGANLETANTYTNTTWVHYVCTYDGTTATVYKDGVLFSSGAKSFNTVNNSDIFKLGLTEDGTTGYFNGAIDDLKIYNYVLSPEEVTSLYNTNTLSTSDFNQNILKVSIYPNPVLDILNIETEKEIKFLEIYNIQGQRVKISNQKQLYVSDLAAGLYLVKIQDFENNSAIKKIVIK